MNNFTPGDLPFLPPASKVLRLLEIWKRSARRWIYPYPVSASHLPLAYYGSGDHSSWGVQASATAFSGLAMLAASNDLDENAAGASRSEITGCALSLLRFLTSTHSSGPIPGPTGTRWGHSWISVLGYSRMFHAIKALEPSLDERDHKALKRIMLSEADFLLEGYPAVGAIDAATGKNKPESNIWNGAFLCRAAALYPESPRAEAYIEQARKLLLNGISIPADAESDHIYSGRALKEWHVGPNFTENYALHHHHYLNVGYMVICLSNIAMAHFAFEDDGIEAPPELYHHAYDLWKLVKTFTFDDGRLWRIGGDTRVRYCYCQDYAIPTWLLAHDQWGDPDAGGMLNRWLDQVALEQNQNADGGFLTGRLKDLADLSPLYYCRLEGDRAASLSMAVCWIPRIISRGARQPAAAAIPASHWSDEFHGAAMVRGNRFASWVWKAAQGPLGTIAPADGSNLVEWEWNLAGKVISAAGITEAKGETWNLQTFAGGFATVGTLCWTENHNIAEGRSPSRIAASSVICVALPDDASVLVLQRAETTRPIHLKETAGLSLKIPNDLFNQSCRTYHFDESDLALRGADALAIPEATRLPIGARFSVDNRLFVSSLYGGELTLHRPGLRQVTLANPYLQHSGRGGSIHCDEVLIGQISEPTFHQSGELLYDIGALLSINDAASARIFADTPPLVRLVEITGGDMKHYLFAINFSKDAVSVALPQDAIDARCLAGTPPRCHGDCSPHVELHGNGGYSFLALFI